MTETRVTNAVGAQVVLKRAEWLMSKQLLATIPDGLTPQDFWDEYCLKHRLRFQQPFPFDVEAAD
jgi:hypothetical protein